MKIVIAGSGDTGTHLAKMLSFEKQDVTLMSDQREYLESIDATYNLMTLSGNPCSPTDLKRAGVQSADMFIGVTPCGTDNMIACEIAKQLGAGYTVARVESDELIGREMEECFAMRGIDSMVYPEALVADDIVRYIKRNWVISWHNLHEGKIIFAGVRITGSSPVAGKRLMDFAGSDRSFHVAAIRRKGKLLIPRGADTLEENDVAYFTGVSGSEEKIARIAGQRVERIRNITVCGEGKLARMILKRLCETDANVTFMSGNRSACLRMAELFPDVTVSNSEPKDLESLREEGVGEMDLFMALGDMASANIVACMMAKEMGVKRTVGQIEDIQYLVEGERLGIDKVVNKKLITSGMILRSILGSKIQVKTVLALEDVEVAEIEVGEGSRITCDAVKNLKIPKELTLGGLVRKGEGMLVEGNTRILPGDRVMVVFLPGTLVKIESLFKSRK